MKSNSKTDVSRRTFFKAVGLGSAGIVGAVLLGQKVQSAGEVAVATVAAPSKAGYQVTEHVQTYYQTARL